MESGLKPSTGVMNINEFVGILSACGLLIICQWLLSHFGLSPSVPIVWKAIFHSVNAFWICSLAGITAASCILAKNRKEVWILSLLALLIFYLAFDLQESGPVLYRCLRAARWVGLFGVCSSVYQSFRPNGLNNLLTVVCFSLFMPVSAVYLALTNIIHSQTMDLYAYAFDLSLNLKIAPYFFILSSRSWVVSSIAIATYVSLLGAYQIVFAIQVRFPDQTVVPALRVFLIAAVLGFASYFVFPAVGPSHFFGSNYPSTLPGLSNFTPMWAPALRAPRNSMPSLHFSWALLLLINIPRKLTYARAFFALYSFLMIVATLGLGEHYFVDLVAALPFVAMTQAFGLCVGYPGGMIYMMSAIRSALLFSLFLVLLAISPEWLQQPSLAWLTTLIIIVHFFFELHYQRVELYKSSGVFSLISVNLEPNGA